MKKNSSSFIWGAVLIIAGIFLAGRALDLFQFNIFFDGWWTLFIIIPCFIGLFNNGGEKTSCLVGLCVGVLLLLACQDFIMWRMFWPLVLAAVFVVIGVKMLLPKSNKHQSESSYQDGNYKTYENDTTYQQDAFNGQSNGSYQNSNNYQNTDNQGQTGGYTYTYSNQQSSYNQSNNSGYQDAYQNARQGTGNCVCSAILSGRDLRFDNQVFQGAMLSAVLGGIELDLRNAIIRENVVIEAKAILGGIDIYVPSYVRVVVNCTPILGGVDNKTITPLGANEQTITIYLNATCVLGGVDVK